MYIYMYIKWQINRYISTSLFRDTRSKDHKQACRDIAINLPFYKYR